MTKIVKKAINETFSLSFKISKKVQKRKNCLVETAAKDEHTMDLINIVRE